MSHAEWKDVLNLTLAVIAREPAPIPVFIYSFAALTVLLVAEGLRALFFRPMSRAVARRDDAQSQAFEARPARFTPRPIAVPARNPKRQIVELRRFQPPRPQIRRTAADGTAAALAPVPTIESLEPAETLPSL